MPGAPIEAQRSTPRSCDQCYARRKRCDRQSPCQLCTRSELSCTYINLHKKRGPKGKVVEKLKHTPGPSHDISGFIEQMADHESADLTPPNLTLVPEPGDDFLELFSPYPPLCVASGTPLSDPLNDLPLLPLDLASLSIEQSIGLVAKYFDHIHPCYPLLEKEWFMARFISGEAFANDASANHFRDLALSLCGVAMAFVTHVLKLDETPSFTKQTSMVISQVVQRHYTQPLGGDSTSLEQVITAFHLGLYFSIVHGDKAGHHRFAEAAHLAKSMELHLPQTYAHIDTDTCRRSLAVSSCVFATNRACELRQGWSEIIHLGQDSQLSALHRLVLPDRPGGNSGASDAQWAAVRHLSRMISLYDIVTPGFARCARDQCELDTCHLTSRDIVRHARKLQECFSVTSLAEFEWNRPFRRCLEEVRAIEFLVGCRWLAAHLWHMAGRHGIDMTTLEGARYASWPLELLSDVARILAASDIASVHALGNGLIARLMYIMACGMEFMNRQLLDLETRKRANDDFTSVSEVIKGWDSHCWTRCLAVEPDGSLSQI